VLLVCSAISAVVAEAKPLDRQHHLWGRFQPGAWKMARTVTQTLNEKEQVVNTSTTETRTILASVGKDGVVLEVQVIVEVAGKRFEAEPQVVKQSFYGDIVGNNLKLSEPSEGHVTIEGRKIPCHIQRLEYTSPNSSHKTTTTLYYSDTVAPYVLRRETTTTDADGSTTLNETTIEVVTLDVPCKVLGEIRSAALVRTITRHAKGTITTLTFTSPEVPGGVVSHTSKETDKAGRLTRRSTLELVDYGLQCDEDAGGASYFGRFKRRPRR
jgi:hypothetical protein